MNAYCRAAEVLGQLKLVVNIGSVIETQDYPGLSAHYHLTLDDPGLEEMESFVCTLREGHILSTDFFVSDKGPR